MKNFSDWKFWAVLIFIGFHLRYENQQSTLNEKFRIR